MTSTSVSSVKSIFTKTFSNDRVSSEAYLTSFPLSNVNSELGKLQGTVFELYGKREGNLFDTQRTWLEIKSNLVPSYQSIYDEANVNGKDVEYSFGLNTNNLFTEDSVGSATADSFNIYHWLSQTNYGSSVSTTRPYYSKMPDITAHIKFKDYGLFCFGVVNSQI